MILDKIYNFNFREPNTIKIILTYLNFFEWFTLGIKNYRTHRSLISLYTVSHMNIYS